jgi:predicted Zn finger-like uncharacterized protein
MLESDFVTRCPKCETTFRVTETQLAAAHGAVRCGACLQVFAANDHLIHAESIDAEPFVTEALIELDDPAGDSSENAGKAIFGVDYFVTKGMSGATPEVEPIEGLDAPFIDARNPEEDMVAARPEESKFAGEAGQSEVVNVSGPDEVALNALFDELNNDGAMPSESREDLSPSDLSDGSTENTVDLDSVEAEPLFRMELEPDSGAKEFKSVVEQEAALPDCDVLEPDVLESDVEAPGDAIDISSERTIPTAAEVVLSNLDDDQYESIELVSNINLEAEVPEEIVGDFEVPTKSHNLSWFLGTVLLTAVLVSQYAYVNIEFLVQQPKLRPYYALFCNYASCRLPAFEDIASIETTELVVRVHPEIERALLVDAIIRNTSIYRQAFPPLEMRFTGINNLVIASRLFLPMEYLGGEMLGLKFIPPRTEVRLGLEIVDPGENAFGYSLEAVQPK